MLTLTTMLLIIDESQTLSYSLWLISVNVRGKGVGTKTDRILIRVINKDYVPVVVLALVNICECARERNRTKTDKEPKGLASTATTK